MYFINIVVGLITLYDLSTKFTNNPRRLYCFVLFVQLPCQKTAMRLTTVYWQHVEATWHLVAMTVHARAQVSSCYGNFPCQ